GVAAGVEGAGEAALAVGGEVGVGLVDVAADLRGQLEGVGSGPGQLAAIDLLAVVGFIAAEDAAVGLVAGGGSQHMAFQAQGLAQCVATAHVDRGVAVAVTVRFVGIAAGAPGMIGIAGGATAGVDAVGALVAALGRDPAALAAVAEAGAGLPQVV